MIVLPITQATTNLIGEEELNLMKPGAFLVNVGRGGIVDEDALAEALKEDRLAGAGLDVFASDPGPLPAGSKLWDLPSVIITPHNAGYRADYAELVVRLFCLNLKCHIRGRQLCCIVNKQSGY